jgi:D-lactate dehydrogenase (cytochrome)
VITEAEMLLYPRPEGVLSALAFFPSDDEAIGFVEDARGDPGVEPAPTVMPLALEFFDSRSLDFLRERKAEVGASSVIPELPDDASSAVLFEQEYVEDELVGIYEAWEELLSRHGSSMERTWGGMDEADLARLKALRHGVAEQVNAFIASAKAECPIIHKVGTDTAVPSAALSEAFDLYRTRLVESGLKYVIFGHIGDNHLHVNIMPTDEGELIRGKELARVFAQHAVDVGGTVAAEHGIGRLKHDFLLLMYGEDGVRQMAAVKRALDPQAILNRGVMFRPEFV